MADITRYPLVRHLRGTATAHVLQHSRGKLRRSGTGLSFWFRPGTAVLSEVPIVDTELPLLFHARTVDFQDVTVQATVTYRFGDPGRAAARIDFGIDPDTGRWRANPLEQVSGVLTETAQQHALGLVANTELTTAVVDSVGAVRDAVAAGLAADERLAETGLTVVGVRVVAIRPEPELEKALQTPTRERVRQGADRATFERRAVAVERERAIGENELQTRIELARREGELVAQQGANARRQAEEKAAADHIEAEAGAQRARLAAATEAERLRLLGEARAGADAARLAAHRDIPEGVLHAMALQQAAAHLPKIDSVVLTPDLLAPVLTKLGAR